MVQENFQITTYFLFILRFLRMSLSLVTLPLIAKYFGVSIERDAWILVTTLFSAVGLAMWGPINETFRTNFVFIKENEGEESAKTKVGSLIGFTILATIFISILIIIFNNQIAHSLDPSEKSPQKLTLIIMLILIMLPTLLINQLTSIGISILNAYDIFYLPEFVGAVSSISNLILIIFIAPIYGIYSLVISQYVATVILFLTVILYLRKITFKYIPFWIINWQDVKVFILFSLPFFLPYFVGQISLFAEKWMANSLANGSVSVLDYARQFSMILQAVISSVLTSVMVPSLAKSFAQKDFVNFSIIVKDNFITIFTIMSLTIPILIGSAAPLSDFFFSQGKVSSDALLLITNLIRIYGISLVGVILYLMFGFILLSSNKGKTFAFWGILAQLIVLCFNIFLVRKWGIYVFPISFGVGHLFTAIILSCFVIIQNKFNIYLSLLKYILVLFTISFLLYIFNLRHISEIPFIQLLANGFVIIFLFLIFSKFLDVNIVLLWKNVVSIFKKI